MRSVAMFERVVYHVTLTPVKDEEDYVCVCVCVYVHMYV